MTEPVPRWRRRAYSVEAMRALARAALPKPVFDFADGGAEDEQTLRRNEAAFEEIALGRARERTRQQRHFIESRLVAPQRLFVLRAAVGEVEHRLRQLRAGKSAHRLDAVGAAPPARNRLCHARR